MDDEDKLELQRALSYGYSNEARPDQLTSFNGEVITYNTDGTPAVYRGLNCTFTRGRLTAIGDNTFVYDASGLRVKKNDTTYTYLEGKLLREQGPDGTLDFLYGADGIMGFVYNGETYFYRKNLFGDVTHIYDADGLLVASYVYDAWAIIRFITRTTSTRSATSTPFVIAATTTMMSSVSTISAPDTTIPKRVDLSPRTASTMLPPSTLWASICMRIVETILFHAGILWAPNGGILFRGIGKALGTM